MENKFSISFLLLLRNWELSNKTVRWETHISSIRVFLNCRKNLTGSECWAVYLSSGIHYFVIWGSYHHISHCFQFGHNFKFHGWLVWRTNDIWSQCQILYCYCTQINDFQWSWFLFHLQIFASPTYEYLDTRYEIKGSSLKFQNLLFRIMVRGGYIAITTFVSALIPFLGDFMSLTGAISTFPLTFILANHMYLVAKRSKLSSLQKLWHWINVIFFGCMSAAAAIAALRLIIVDSKTYHIFADLWCN